MTRNHTSLHAIFVTSQREIALAIADYVVCEEHVVGVEYVACEKPVVYVMYENFVVYVIYMRNLW